MRSLLPNDTDYISLGNNSAYSSVGRLDCNAHDAAYLASGTLIAPNWVLTAAHVFDHAKTVSFSIGGETYQGRPHDRGNPNWNGNMWSGYDIGLIHLSKPVKNVTPASLYTGAAELNQVDTTVGYGLAGDGALRAARSSMARNGPPRMSSTRSTTAGCCFLDFASPTACSTL